MRIAPRGRRQPKSVTLVYGGVAVALLLVIAAVALIVAPPAPPSIAEYAPQATERIDEALKAQSSKFGEGDGGTCAEGQDCVDVGGGGGGEDESVAPPTSVRRVIDIKRVRRCVGDPPRQTEDPQSPPCVNYWEGDNGGSTYQGVTRDEILVVLVLAAGTAHVKRAATLAHFNNRYEFYGRHIRVETVACPQSCAAKEQQAIVEEVKAMRPFAALLGGATAIDHRVFQRELADAGIVTVTGAAKGKVSEVDPLHPYAWRYGLADDEAGIRLADMVCKSLKDRKALHGGPEEMAKQRKFEILTVVTPTGPDRGYMPMERALRACGIEAGVTELASADRTVFADLKGRDVTTLLTAMTPGVLGQMMTTASQESYYPEWVHTGTGDAEAESLWTTAPADQRAHLLAQAAWNKGQPRADSPWWWALTEVGRTDEAGSGVDGVLADGYRAWLVLASGIQAAGPNLTPHSFGAKLQALKYPNPGAGAEPYYQATVGFRGDHTMVDDTGLAWWSEAAPAYSSRTSEVGGWCYVNQGIRWKTYPLGSHAFQQQPCR